jgi:hypothetical protein
MFENVGGQVSIIHSHFPIRSLLHSPEFVPSYSKQNAPARLFRYYFFDNIPGSRETSLPSDKCDMGHLAFVITQLTHE